MPNDMPGLGFGNFLSGALHETGNYVAEERKRQRDLEDQEYERRRGGLQHLYEGVQRGEVHPHYYAQIVKDLADLDAQQKNPKRAKGVKGFMGGHETPITPFYDLLMQGQIPTSSSDPRSREAQIARGPQMGAAPQPPSALGMQQDLGFDQYIPSMGGVQAPDRPSMTARSEPENQPGLFITPLERFKQQAQASMDVKTDAYGEAAENYRLTVGPGFDPYVYAAMKSGHAIPRPPSQGSGPSKTAHLYVDADGENAVLARESPEGGLIDIQRGTPLPPNYHVDTSNQFQPFTDQATGELKWVRKGTNQSVASGVTPFQRPEEAWTDIPGTNQQQFNQIDPVKGTRMPVQGVTRISPAYYSALNDDAAVASRARAILDTVYKDVTGSEFFFGAEKDAKTKAAVDKEIRSRYNLDADYLRSVVSAQEKNAGARVVGGNVPPPPAAPTGAPPVKAATDDYAALQALLTKYAAATTPDEQAKIAADIAAVRARIK